MNQSLVTWGIILLAVGLIGGLYFYSQQKDCSTGLSAIGNVLSETQKNQCNTNATLMYGFIVIGVVGIVLLAIGAARNK